MRHVVAFIAQLSAWPSTPTRISRHRRHKSSNAEFHLSLQQLDRIIAAASNTRDRLLIRTMVETGVRRAEIASFEIRDLRTEDSTLVVRHGKGDKMRIVPIVDDLAQQLTEFIGPRSTGPIFVNSRGDRLSLRHINRIVAKAGVSAAVPNPNPRQRNITCHLFRHSFARLWKGQGGSIETLARIMGHSSVKTTWDLYGKDGMEDVKKQYRVLMRGFRGKRG